MTGKHKLNLHSKEFTDFSYFDFVDNITDENSSKVYFEIDSFISQVHNSAFRDDNIEVNAQNVMITQKDQEEIEKIKKKTPFDSLTISIFSSFISSLISSFCSFFSSIISSFVSSSVLGGIPLFSIVANFFLSSWKILFLFLNS